VINTIILLMIMSREQGRVKRNQPVLKLSTKGRYAARIMLFLALAENNHHGTKIQIARAEAISADYVEQILMRLKIAGLVRSRRGAKGGFSLTRDPKSITIAEVLQATEGPLSIVPCLPVPACPRATLCATRTLWKEASEALERIFSRVTLADLAERARSIHNCPLSFDIPSEAVG